MYKYLLCWRYLRTRYIALASVISVMLGVATLIVVNSVMGGFSKEMKTRLHGILSDISISSRDFGGMLDPDMRMEQVRRVLGDKIEAMTPTVTAPSMLYFKSGNGWVSQPVQVIGIDMDTYPQVSVFSKYLQHPENRKQPSFTLRESGYDTIDHQLQQNESFVPRDQLEKAGWYHRRIEARCNKFTQQLDGVKPASRAAPTEVKTLAPPAPVSVSNTNAPVLAQSQPAEPSFGHATASDVTSDPAILTNGSATGSDTAPNMAPSTAPSVASNTPDPFGKEGDDPFGPSPFDQIDGAVKEKTFDPEFEQRTGIIVGIGNISSRNHEGRDWFAAIPGDDVNLTIPTTGQPPKGVSDSFTLVDVYESKMSESDQLVFVPIRHLQTLRGMIDPITGIGRVNQIQIKLKPGVDLVKAREALSKAFDARFFSVMTWMDMQGALLQAVELEQTILNILLFLIIAVAGFGILAIFLMIVVEKTRDIGILKSLGASKFGIMGIFLHYGVLLGLVGSGVGVILGLYIVKHINDIADFLSRMQGKPIFDPAVYYFPRVPTVVEPMMVVGVVVGTMLIVILASILPALRAALMHPVEALRHE